MPKHLRKKTLDGNLETLILAVLEEGPTYGYALVQSLNDAGDGLLKLGEGTIYPVLHRLEDRGLITAEWQVGDNGRQRKYYRVTRQGNKQLTENRQQWAALQQVMTNVINPKPA